MEDVSPKLLKEITQVFNDAYKSNSSVMAFARKTSKGRINYNDCNRYAQQICKCFEKAIKTVLVEENLPDGTLYFNIAKSILIPVLKNNHDLIYNAFNEASKVINSKEGLRISSVKTNADMEKIMGIIKNACEDDIDLTTAITRICSNGSNFTMKSLDEMAQENARHMVELGFEAQVIRTAEAGCCEWCYERAGTYNYSEVKDTGNDVWLRHAGCNCEISYVNTSKPRK